MNKNLDLTKILKGLEGIKLYTSIWGYVELVEIKIDTIKVKTKNSRIEYLTREGKFYLGYEDSECIIFPSKEQRNWNKFSRPIEVEVDTPVMCKSNTKFAEWQLRYYRNFDISKGKHIVFPAQLTSKTPCSSCELYTYIVLFKDFNPDNLEENIKHNIQTN